MTGEHPLLLPPTPFYSSLDECARWLESRGVFQFIASARQQVEAIGGPQGIEGPPEVHLRPLVAASVVRRPGSALYLLVFHVRPGNGSRVTDANRAPRPQGSRNGETSPCGLIGGHGRPMRPLRVALRNISDGRQRVKGGARRPF